MKRVLIMLGILAFLGVIVWVFIIIIGSNIKLSETQYQRIGYSIAGGVFTLLGQYIISLGKKNLFGGWVVYIVVDGKMLEDEKEPLSWSDAEKIIDYFWIYLVAFSIREMAYLKNDLAAEGLLRDCCESLGKIKGNPIKYATIKPKERSIILTLQTDVNLIPW